MDWNDKSLKNLMHLDVPSYRKAIYDVFMEELKDMEPEVILEPANIANTSFKGPQSDIPIRIYTPKNDSGAKLPAIVFYHGGGFIFGGLDSHDCACRRICVESGAIVIAVDYRVASEHPFPAAVIDCYATLEYVFKNADALNIDANRIAVGGDSSGGNLATVVSILARDNNGPSIIFQCLIYPVTDFTRDHTNSDSDDNGRLRGDQLAYIHKAYLKDSKDENDIRASPLKADLTGLPPAWILLGEYDPLTPEGADYAKKLKSQGVPVELKIVQGRDHGFFTIPSKTSNDTVQYQEEAAAVIKQALA